MSRSKSDKKGFLSQAYHYPKDFGTVEWQPYVCILTQRMLHQIQYMKEANCLDPVEKILDQLYLRRSRIRRSRTTRGHFLVLRLLFVGDLLYVLLSSLSLFTINVCLYELMSGVDRNSSKIEVSCFSS